MFQTALSSSRASSMLLKFEIYKKIYTMKMESYLKSTLFIPIFNMPSKLKFVFTLLWVFWRFQILKKMPKKKHVQMNFRLL